MSPDATRNNTPTVCNLFLVFFCCLFVRPFVYPCILVVVPLFRQVNIISFFEVSKAAIKHMKPGGTIINTGSIQAYDPSHPILDYACTKVRVSG